MAGQVSNWVYKNIDKAYLVGSTPWSYNAVQDTQRDLWKHFSGTTLFKDKTVMLDNYYYNFELNSWSGLVLRPITGNNGWTAVCNFKLYEDDSKWKSSLQGIYGEYPILAAIRLIASGCGLTVTDIAWQRYLDDILEDVAGQLGITVSALRSKKLNTHIANVSGYNVAAYVDKHIVDMFIKAMHDAGMFDYTTDMPDTLPASTIELGEPEETLEEYVTSMCNDFNNSEAFQTFKEEYPAYEGWTIEPEFVLQHITDAFTAHDLDIADYKYFNMRISCSIPTAGSTSTVGVSFSTHDFSDDSVTLTQTYNKVETDYGWEYNFSLTDVARSTAYYTDPDHSTQLNAPYYYFNIAYDTSGEQSYIYGNPTFERSEFSQSTTRTLFSDIYEDHYNMTYGHYVYYITVQRGNYGTSKIWPEGITLQEDAVAPKKSTTSSSRWSNWTGRAKTIYGDTSRSPASYTFIPLGYGDIDYYDQSRVQGGVVYSNYYLDLLGVTLEMIDDYEPGVDPDPGEDPDPIIPDPEPTPDPTPDDPEMEMTANRLFKVHQVTGAQVDALGGFIYSSTFIEAIKNMFTEPMDAIIGCFVLNYSTAGTLPIGTTETLKLGSVLGGTGVTGQPITNQFMTLDFGHKTINEYYGNVEDYAPYSKAECFLPYIGFVDIDINEIMNSTVNIKYVIDIYTGCCLAKIFVTKGGATQELYNFNGNCAIMVPLTGRDFTNGLMNFTTGAIGVIGGAVTGNPVAAVLGAKSAIGNISSIRRSGSISSNVGALGCQKPFILIKRPKAYNAPNYNQFYGYPSNWTVSLGSCSGYTRVKEVHLDHIVCTDAEREEINQRLHQGVIF